MNGNDHRTAVASRMLQQLAVFIKDGTHGTHQRVENGVPLLSAKNISESGMVVWDEEDSRITERDYDSIHKTYELEEEDLLLTIVGSLGRRALYRSGPRITFQRSVAIIRPDREQIVPSYLFHASGLPNFQRQLVQRANATAQAGLYLGELEQITVPYCSLPEQRRIAEILDTADEAIRRTDALIGKLKAMKQGLLHDLLTRGLDDHGELRPPATEAPHLYLDSPLGKMPKGWEVSKLGDACNLIKDGTHLPPERVAAGPLLLSVRNMENGHLVLTDDDTRVPMNFYRNMHHTWEIRTGDVLLAIVGATIGKIAFVPSNMPLFTLQRSVAVLRGKPRTLHNLFMFYFLASPVFQLLIWQRVNQTAQPGIYLAEIAELKVPLPPAEKPFDEQQAIVDVLDAHDARIRSEESARDKLLALKKGLVEDLLTGRVRVKPISRSL